MANSTFIEASVQDERVSASPLGCLRPVNFRMEVQVPPEPSPKGHSPSEASPKHGHYLGSREPWRRMRARGMSYLSELSQRIGTMSNDENSARSQLLCEGLHNLWQALDTVLDTQAMLLAKEQEQRHKEAAEHRHDLSKVRREEKISQAALTPALDFSRMQLQDLPHAFRAIVEENRALKAKVRGYKVRATHAERLLSDAESAIIQLELDNAKLNLQVKECSISPEKVAQLQKSVTQSASKDETIQDLENRLRVMTDKAQADKRLYVQQIKGMQRQMAIIQDNQESCIAAYTQPLIYVKNHAPPSPPPVVQLPNIGEFSTEPSELANKSDSDNQPRVSPKRVQPSVVRAVCGPAAHGTGNQVLPALSAENSNASSNRNGRSGHKRAAAPARAGDVNAGRQLAMQILTPGAVQPFVGRSPHLAGYPEKGGSDPTLVRAVTGSALVLRVLPSSQTPWQSPTSPSSAQASPAAAAAAHPAAAAVHSPKSPYLAPAKHTSLQVLVQPNDAAAQQHPAKSPGAYAAGATMPDAQQLPAINRKAPVAVSPKAQASVPAQVGSPKPPISDLPPVKEEALESSISEGQEGDGSAVDHGSETDGAGADTAGGDEEATVQQGASEVACSSIDGDVDDVWPVHEVSGDDDAHVALDGSAGADEAAEGGEMSHASGDEDIN